MSKIKLPLRRINLVLLILSLYLISATAEDSYLGSVSYLEVQEKLGALEANVDLRLTPEVKTYLKQYLVTGKHSSETLIGRSLFYFPMFENKIYEKQMPDEIKYLAIIESSLRPAAKSRVGAAGLWQFMKATARMYGLKMNGSVDERRDPEKSTEAALTYLSDLHERFGDWTIALAAYNCGPGNVRKAMRKAGRTDYWSIRRFLPKETQNYVPKFIAMTYLMNYYYDHGLEPNFQEQLFLETRKAVIYDRTSLRKVSEHSGLEVDEVRQYNPALVGNYIPRSEVGTVITLPSSSMYAYLGTTDQLDLIIPTPEELEAEEEPEVQIASQKMVRNEHIEIAPISNLDYLISTIEIEDSHIELEIEPVVPASAAATVRKERFRSKIRQKIRKEKYRQIRYKPSVKSDWISKR